MQELELLNRIICGDCIEALGKAQKVINPGPSQQKKHSREKSLIPR